MFPVGCLPGILSRITASLSDLSTSLDSISGSGHFRVQVGQPTNTMNEKYPYPIDNAQHIPSSLEGAQRAYDLLGEFKDDLASADTATFLDGWFAMQFMGIAKHPDEVDEWADDMKPYALDAWRRHEVGEINEDQLYCSDSQHQGLRLQQDGNLRCYAMGTLGDQIGYISAMNDPEHGNQPVLTGVGSMAYIYESPRKAAYACRHLKLDKIEIYAGSPDRDLECPPMTGIPVEVLLDKEVVIQTEEGLYLYRDGKTLGDSHVLACKYMLYGDNVEQQIQQVKTTLGVTWKWVDYSTLIGTRPDDH